MSKAAKQSLIILVVLLLGSLAFAGYTLLEKQKLEKDKANLQKDVQQYQGREKQNLVEISGLKDQLTKTQ